MRILIDGNAMGWAHHSASLLTYAGIQTQAIYGYARMLRDIAAAFPEGTITVLWDGHAKRRFAMLPEYKSTREKNRATDPESAERHRQYMRSKTVLMVMLELMGIAQVLHPEYEADDLAGVFCARLPGPKMLVTGDSDWLQLVSEGVSWWDPRKDGKRVNMGNFHQATGYATPDEYLHGKVLIGDTTDDIPGIPGIGGKTAAEFIARWRTIDAFFAAVDAGIYTPASRKSKDAKTPHPEQFLASPEGRALVDRNFKLMDLRNPVIENSDAMTVRKYPVNEDALKTLFQRLGFVSLLREWEHFVAPFARRLQPA